MSFDADERFMQDVAAALRKAGLDAVVVGNAAGIMHCADLTTQDIDLLVRDTEANEPRIKKFVALIGGSGVVPLGLDVERVQGTRIPVDLVYDGLPGNLSFAAVKRRAERVSVGRGESVMIAALTDVIKSKEARDRPKDRAAMPLLKAALAINRKLR